MPHVLSEDTQVNLYRQSFLRQSLFLLYALPTLFELSTETSGAAPVLNQDQVYFYNVYLYVKNAVTVPDKTTEFHTCTEKSIVHKLKFYLFKSKWFSYNKIYILNVTHKYLNETLDLDLSFHIKLEEWKRLAFRSTSFPVVNL